MEAWGWALLILAAVVAVGVIAWAMMQRRRSTKLREGFGPEYAHTVEERGDRRKAEAELAERKKRVDKLHVRALTPQEHERYSGAWRATQTRFVDSPGEAIAEADRLIAEVMTERGYPVTDFDQRTADISVDHPHVVANYRAGHQLYLASTRGEATTEDLRQAMMHYRALFDELLEAREPARAGERR
jgi:hypothetical protein